MSRAKTIFNFACLPVGMALLTMLVLLAKPASAVNSGQFTLSLWVNPTGSVASKALLAKAEEFRIFTNASGYVGCQIKTTTWQNASNASTRPLAAGTWSHVVCTYDLVNLKVYVNGINVASTALAALPDDTANLLKIGQDDSASTTYTNLAGVLDDFKFYNYALTSDEIKLEYNRGSALQMGSVSNTSLLSGGSIASSSASAAYCIPGDTATCAPPVGEWSFNEGSGGTVNDSSGNSNTGTWSGTGTTHWTTGKIGKAGKFNGSSDYVDCGGNTFFNFGTNTFMVEFWFKTTYSGYDSPMVNKGSTYKWLITPYGPNNIRTRLMYVSGSADRDWAVSAYNNGKWHHFVWIINRDTNLQYAYYDGVYKGAQSSIPVGQNVDSSDPLYIGRYGQYRNTGSIDQVQIYNYARSAKQIMWDYNRGKPVGWWGFDDCSGTTAVDWSGNLYNGTLTGGTPGTCSDASGTSAWNRGSTGKYNASLYFDGTNYVNQATSITGAQTVGFWVYPTDTSQSFLQLSSTATVTSSGGTVTAGAGFASPTIFVNGQLGQLVKLDQWNHIVVTTATGITANAVKFGLVGSTYYTGQMDEVKIFNYPLTAVQVKNEFNQGAAVRFGPSSGNP